MKRSLGLIFCAVVLTGAADAQQEEPSPTPENITIAFGLGALAPVGRFSDAADVGFSYSFSGFYAMNEYFGPTFVFQQGFLDSDPSTGVRGGSVDTYSLAGGLRIYLAPKTFPVRPWATVLGGWHRYAQHRHHDLRPAFALGHTSRDDGLFSAGGGFELRLHPNVGIGTETRVNLSFSDSLGRGERDLKSISAQGLIIFHY